MYAKHSKEPQRVIVYGLDKKDFELPTEPVKLDDRAVIEFVPFGAPVRLDDADGTVVPQGAFEKVEVTGRFGDLPVVDEVREWKELGARERQTWTLLEHGGWVCFLVGRIIDLPLLENRRVTNCRSTDLCKRVLNKLGIRREETSEIADASARDPRFNRFVETWGVAETQFFVTERERPECRVLAQRSRTVVGFEHKGSTFFLPFRAFETTADGARRIASELVSAVLEYREQRLAEPPAWGDEFRFRREAEVASDIEKHETDLRVLREEFASWRQYKVLLVASGDRLREEVLRAVREFFGLSVDPTDDRREDFKILDDAGAVLCFVECRGTNKGVQLADVNQVDTNRERSGGQQSTPGLLVINCDRSIEDLHERLSAQVQADQIRRGAQLNVLIVRAVDLLFLMWHLEGAEVAQRRAKLLGLLKEAGGWLRAGPEKYEIVKE
jgi:hypothetical protein